VRTSNVRFLISNSFRGDRAPPPVCLGKHPRGRSAPAPSPREHRQSSALFHTETQRHGETQRRGFVFLHPSVTLCVSVPLCEMRAMPQGRGTRAGAEMPLGCSRGIRAPPRQALGKGGAFSTFNFQFSTFNSLPRGSSAPTLVPRETSEGGRAPPPLCLGERWRMASPPCSRRGRDAPPKHGGTPCATPIPNSSFLIQIPFDPFCAMCYRCVVLMETRKG